MILEKLIGPPSTQAHLIMMFGYILKEKLNQKNLKNLGKMKIIKNDVLSFRN